MDKTDLFTPTGYERWPSGIWRLDGRKKDLSEMPHEKPNDEVEMSEERKAYMMCVYSGALNVPTVARDIITKEMWIQLEERGVVKPVWLPLEWCASNVTLSKQSKYGFRFTNHGCHRVVDFIVRSTEDRKIHMLSSRQGAIETPNGWGWLLGQKWIGPARTVVYPSPISGNYGKAICSSGTLDEWLSAFREIVIDHGVVPRWLTFAMFAAPLLRWINMRTFLIHHWGKSGGGKTAMAEFGASVWGRAKYDGEGPKLTGSLNATEMSILEEFREIDDLPVIRDELQAAKFKNDPSKIVNLIMSLVLGQSRQRLNSKGQMAAPQVHWRSVVRFTGEQPLLGQSAYDLGGASARIIQLRADAMDEKSAKRLHVWMDRKHTFGVAGEAFLRALLPVVNNPIKVEKLQQLAEELHEEIERRAGTDDRRLVHFSAVATAQVMASRLFFKTPLAAAKLRAVEDALDMINLAGMHTTIDDYSDRAWDFLNEHLSAEPGKYIDLSDETQANQLEQGRHGEIVGVINRSRREVRWYIPSKINTILRREGYDINRFWDDAIREGRIGTTKNGKNHMPERNFGRFRARVYVVTKPGGSK